MNNHSDSFPYPPALDAIIDAAFARLHETLRAAGPTVADCVHAWMESLGGVARQKDGYKHPLSYPMLLFPWWAEKTIHNPPDTDRQTDLAYSTVCGYYAIRLIDNLMDGHSTIELDILPALHVFEAEFQGTYHDDLACDHGFWVLFSEVWYRTAEVTLQDARATEIDLEHFMQVTARKTEAVKIPIAAVCYGEGRHELLDAWSDFVDLFGCWHQMSNDLFDWQRDMDAGTRTYFLSEAQRQSEPGEPVIGWVAREGFDWAMCALEEWMAALKNQARALGSPDLMEYLGLRERMLNDRRAALGPGLSAASRLFDLLSNAKRRGEKSPSPTLPGSGRELCGGDEPPSE